LWRRKKAGCIALGEEWSDEVGIPRQYMDRDGPWRIGRAADHRRGLVIAEQYDEPVAGQVFAEPPAERREIVVQGLEVFGPQSAPVRLPIDLLHRGCRDARKCPGIAPVSKVWRYRRERDVARDQDYLDEYGRVGPERRSDLRRAVQGELVRDFEPAEGWTTVI